MLAHQGYLAASTYRIVYLPVSPPVEGEVCQKLVADFQRLAGRELAEYDFPIALLRHNPAVKLIVELDADPLTFHY